MSIVIAAVPYVDTIEPIMAPALLKSTLKTYGFESVGIDLNILIVNKLAVHPEKQKILDFFFSQIVHEEVLDDIVDIIDLCAGEIIKHQPTVIALSLLIYSCQIFTRWLCARLRDQVPNAKIVIGGTGIKNFVADSNSNFLYQLKDLSLIDDYIHGDGDRAFYEYIIGNYSYIGINTVEWKPIQNLNDLPYPDFSDYNFALYKKKVIPINDSRGCVKNCEFCDVIEYWEKFQFRTADNIFAEMLYQIETLNLHDFSFRSSLVNGNLKEFKKLIDLIADYNSSRPRNQQISWEGYFIIRSSSQHTPDLFKKIKASNGMLLVGVESLVYRVRSALGKTFSDQELEDHMNLAREYQVPWTMLLIIAYPTETLEDYEYTKKWFLNKKDYANNSIKTVGLSLASILPGTQLSRNADKYNVQKGKLPSIWINQNLKITEQQRVEYLLELQKICVDTGLTAPSNLQTIEHTVKHDY